MIRSPPPLCFENYSCPLIVDLRPASGSILRLTGVQPPPLFTSRTILLSDPRPFYKGHRAPWSINQFPMHNTVPLLPWIGKFSGSSKKADTAPLLGQLTPDSSLSFNVQGPPTSHPCRSVQVFGAVGNLHGDLHRGGVRDPAQVLFAQQLRHPDHFLLRLPQQPGRLDLPHGHHLFQDQDRDRCVPWDPKPLFAELPKCWYCGHM